MMIILIWQEWVCIQSHIWLYSIIAHCYMIQMQEEPDPNLFIRNILSQFEQDQVETTRHILQQIESASEDSLNLLKTLNLLLNSKALPSRQRRDVAAIARLVADSNILTTLQGHIRVQTQSHNICRVDGYYLQTIKLIGSICWQNPHFIDNILTSSPKVIDLLFSLLKDQQTVPSNDQALINIINFMHSISLKQGPIRDEKLADVFTTFIQNIFTKDKFFQCLQSKKLSSLFSTIQKFHSNVKNIDKYVYNALIRSIIEVNDAYKRIEMQFQTGAQDNNAVIETKKAIKINDRKLVALLKLQQKSRSGLFEQIDPFRFVVYLKIIMKIAVNRRFVLVETAYENKILISSIAQIIRSIKDWKDHLDENHPEKEEGAKQQKQRVQELSGDAQSEMVDESKANNKEAILNEITTQYFLNTKDEKAKFQAITATISTFSEKPNKIIIDAINNILQAHRKLQSTQQPTEENPLAQAGNYNNFRIQQEGSRLDRILTIVMKLMDQKQLMKKQYYKTIVSKLYDIYSIFSKKGHSSQMKAVRDVLPQLNSLTTQSDLSCNRFIFRKIDQDHFKSNLHLKITAVPNSYNLISDTILKFGLYLSEYKEYLEHCTTQFLHKTLQLYETHYLRPMRQKEKLSLQDIELLRSMVKTVAQMFPNHHKCVKDELVRIKLYYYCILIRKNNYPVNLFEFSANVIYLLDKYNPSSTQELEDSLQNRQEVTKTIFYKLVTHRLKLFFTTLINFYDDLRKLSTPREAHAPIGKIEIQRELMFTGNIAYVECMEQVLKLLVIQKGKTRQNPLKEQVVGLLLLKLYDFRILDVYEQDPEIQNQEKEFREDQTKKYNTFIEQKCQSLFQWVISNSSHVMYKLPMLVKKILHFQKEEYIFQSLKKSQNQLQIQYATQCFLKVSQMISQSYYLIQGSFLDLGIKINKKKSKAQQISEQFDLGKEVLKLANACIIISEFMNEYNASGLAQKCINVIPQNYITSLINFSRVYISKFAVEVHFPDEANYLIKATLWVIENYLAYKSILVEQKQKRRKKKRREYKKLRKHRVSKKKESIKKSKAKKKNIAKQNRSSEKNQSNNNLQSNNSKNLSENDKSRKPKGSKKRKLKEKQSNQTKTLQKNSSKTNLHSQEKIQTQKSKKGKNKKESPDFQTKVQNYIKTILLLSNKGQKPFLKNITLQYIIKFISSNVKKNVLSKPPFKYFQLKMSDFISDLLKVELAEKKIGGYHLLLSRIGLKLINQEHMRVDFQTGIKRFFYDHSGQKIGYIEFINFLQTNFQRAPNLSHILQIVYEEPGSESPKEIPFTYQNTQGIQQTGKSKHCFVRIKENVELSMLTVNNKNDKKGNTAKEEEKKEKTIKLSDYVPEGQICLFIYQMINYAIQSIIFEIDKSMEYLKTKDIRREQQTHLGETIQAFNAKIVIHTLQFLIRESPTLAPWIAKFKCKKIILNTLKNQKIINKQQLSKYIFSLLNNYEEQSQNLAQIGFLQVILRLFSPFLLNSVSGIIFEMCLDSTPLVNNPKSNNESQQQKQKYISFGSVVRQKVVSQLDSILFGGNPLDHIFRKAAALNSLSVLINIREMAKLLIQCNFISKIYHEYHKIVKQYANGKQTFLMPGAYLNKIYIPFFLQILSVLQQLNIAFHHNKKLIKNQHKTMLNSLILNEESINSQLIPMDVFKKTKFKYEWPLGKEQPKKENRHEQRFFPNESDQDSFYRENEEQDSFSDQSSESEEEESVESDLLEERFAQLQRMDQEESYMSLEEGNHSHLLSDQWDYSNSHDSEMQHQERLMQEEMQRQLIQNELQNQAIDQDPDNEDIDQLQELSQGQMQQLQNLQDQGIQIDDQDQQDGQSDSLQDGGSQFISSFMSMDEQQDMHQHGFSPREQLLFKHKEEEEFYESASDIINFEKINVVPRISKIEVIQIINLRFLLQIFSYPQRQFQNSLSKRTKSNAQNYEEKKVQDHMILLQAFSKDQEFALSHKVQWRQVYRYEHLLKKHPICETVLTKIFTDEHEVGVSRMRRRNAVIHRNGLIQIFSGPFQAVREDDYGHELPVPIPRLDRSQVQSESARQPASENNDQNASGSPHEANEDIPIESQSSHSSQSQIEQQQQQQMPEENILIRDDYDLIGNNQAIQQILRQLNMNMTAQEFHMLSAEIQNDIIQNYYMVNDERALHNIHRELHNLPIENEGEIPERLDLRTGRVRQPDIDMSPRIGGENARREQNEQQSNSEQNGMSGLDEGLQDEYRKMSMQHTMKVNKDIMQTINKNGKNNNKFYEVQDEQLQKIINLVFQLNEKEYRNYPYSLTQTCCINTVNLQKIISTLIALLYLYSDKIEQEQQENNIRKYFAALKIQLQTTDKEAVKPKLTIKILYLLSHLTKNYSISMTFLKINKTVPKQLQGCLQLSQTQKTSLQMLIMLLEQSYIYKNGQLLQFLISVIENITIHHFYKSINALVQSNKDSSAVQDQNINQPIRITEEAARLLCNLLQNNYAKEYLHSLSIIIMRLSINESNLSFFIKFMYKIVEQLSNLCLNEMQKIISSKQGQLKENSQKQYLKIVNLMNIFFEMVISFKSYPTSPEKHEAVLKDLRKIVEMQILQVICQKAASYLFQSNDQKVQTTMGEILEIYFILYEIALATSDFSQQVKPEDLNHKHIAGLGHIKQLRKLQKSNQLKKEQDLILGKFNLSKLWKQSISQPVFKTYINNCIKRKLSNFNQQQTNINQSIFDVPIFKVAISTPHMLSFDNKRLIFKNELKRLRKKSKYHMIHMSIRREQVFQDSFTEIMHYDSQILKGKIKIQFKDEQGEDAGGITREWFQLLSKKMFDPNYALFKSGSTGNTFHPSPQSYINNLHLKYFKFIGRIIGKALYDGYLLDAYFTPAFYKHILNLPITYLDMQQQDYEYFKSLKWILDNSPIQDFLQLNFTYSFDNFGQIQTKDLIPGGADILVTEQNKLEYVQLSSYAKMATSIESQLEALLQGFHELIPHKLIKIFNEKELEIMISGRPTIDIEDLKRNTELVNYVKNDQIITWLFQVLQSFDMELRTAFLQFVTGSSRVPVEGFKDLRGMNGVQKFNIHKQFQQERLPRAHTCFNQLDLPNYKTKEILIEKLMLAITEGKQGFHMI